MVKLAFVVSVVFSLIVINNAVELEPKIVRGYSASAGQFPYFAFLEAQNGHFLFSFFGGGVSACGATLISDQWLITAAHCLRNVNTLTVHLGKTQLDQPERSHLPIKVDRRNFFIFPGYNGDEHDIALIRLPQKIRFTQHIRPLTLPKVCKSTENLDCLAVGNGATSNNGGVSPQLNFAFLKTLPGPICRRIYPHINTKAVICAHNNVQLQSVCSGDSGGPLVSRAEGHLIGISAFVRREGCEHGIPQGFTNVYPYLGWISRKTGLALPRC